MLKGREVSVEFCAKMNRQNRFASSQEQVRRQPTIRNIALQANGGRMLSDGNSVSMHMRQVAVEDARRKMEMKYKKEAEEAAEKKKEREQKKREAWLARQEALVRPGRVLGTGRTAEQNLLHDYVENQQDMNETEQSWLEQQYNAPVQQRIQRDKEAVQSLQRRQEQSKGMKLTGQRDVRPETVARSAALGNTSRYSLPNRTSDYFLGTGYSATQASSNSNGRANRGTVPNTNHVFVAGSTAVSARSDSCGFAVQSAVAKSGHVLGGGNTAALPRSDNCVRDVQARQRREMLASRRRLQEQYNVQVRQAAEAKKQSFQQNSAH
ncbi:hypothetical protein B7P43_G03598 [Cryptotermes secundus]|uniref:Uncharacterized protein n=1 Tax=Cryptotermes secundus TaxID=105785 RepID=A0A2J7PZY7_9NEOP|nr:uncharacterized protein LOC111870719 isoform X2 [Cryptotermes secundus]PNF21905.1 hypothetical protein B7P43_G03598 [Cryptotermes secundus]